MLEAFVTLIGTATLGAFAWVFQLGTRVTKVETRNEDLEKILDAKFLPIHQRLDRIERSLNGHLYRD